MDIERYGLAPGQHIPGAVVHRYFSDFARRFGLDKLVRYRTRVKLPCFGEMGLGSLTMNIFAIGSELES